MEKKFIGDRLSTYASELQSMESSIRSGSFLYHDTGEKANRKLVLYSKVLTLDPYAERNQDFYKQVQNLTRFFNAAMRELIINHHEESKGKILKEMERDICN